MSSMQCTSSELMDFLEGGSSEREEKDPSTSTTTNIAQKVIGLLGVPGFIINTFGPQILTQARRNPRLFRIITPLIIAFSAAAALTHLIWPLFNSIIGEWLPFAQLKSDDPLYDYLCRWVHFRKDPLRHLQVDAQSAAYRRQQVNDKLWWPEDHAGAKDICFEKSGKRFFWFERTLFILEAISWSGRRSYYNDSKDVKLKAFSFSHRPIKAVLQEAWNTYQNEEGSRTTRIWHCPEDDWDVLAHKQTRPLDTVDVDDMEKTKLVKDLKKYLSDETKEWYARRGIPYRRGYLFHGPPGTGKTSLSMAIAGHFNIDLYVLSLANPRLSDGMLTNLMTSVDEPCVVLLEDIDSAGLSREVSSTMIDKPKPPPPPRNDDDDKDYDKMGRIGERVDVRYNITLSGVLNALDGAASPEGHVLIMSTNHPEALDPALARAGRVDYKVEFKNATFETAKNIFKRMVGDETQDLEELATIFAKQIPNGKFSPAELQGYLLNYIGDVDGAMTDLDSWLKKSLEEKANREKLEAEKKGIAPKPAEPEQKTEPSEREKT
ncbi:hypothetical protein LTR64_005866 [Lithohypha guttulata]|uniref:uncharacterized protein n=1 Tax=Lithohypha guttulata TaxID=1690604 RepID=UPI002DE141C9|nr:hypothetical protein LTR51_002339 [Lithohypha guttulata]